MLNVVEVLARRSMTDAATASFDQLNTWPHPDAPDGAPAGFRGEVTADAWLSE